MMMKKPALAFICCIAMVSCTHEKKQEAAESSEPGVRVVKEFHPNGNLKSSIEALGNLRHGVSRIYRLDGTLENEISYFQNRKHGPAKNYYADGKTVKLDIMYENGYKHGEARWYFPSGKVYRVTPYENNMINGMRRTYYENGRLQAELPYSNDQPGTGLKEYTREGKQKEFSGEILIREVDRISLDNSFTLVLSISDGTSNVEFYTGKLSDGIYWNEQLTPVNTEGGTGTIFIHVSKGTFKMETMNMVARIKTGLGNTRILQKEYHLAVENKL